MKMHHAFLLIPLAAVTARVSAQTPAPVPSAAEVRAHIEQANTRFMDAFNRGDAAALAAMYTPDALLLAPNAPPVKGPEQIQALWAGAKQMGLKTLRMEVADVEVSGDAATEVGNYTLVIQPAGQPEAIDRGKYLVVWKRQPDGTWKLHRDIFNTSLPPQAPPAATEGPRAAAGDTVWVILNHVRAEKRAEFEHFLHEVFWPMGRRVGETDPVVARTFAHTRILHPTRMNQDGTYTYAFIMDPRVNGADYSIARLLREGFSEEEADRLYREGFRDALARPQESRVMVQSRN